MVKLVRTAKMGLLLHIGNSTVVALSTMQVTTSLWAAWKPG